MNANGRFMETWACLVGWWRTERAPGMDGSAEVLHDEWDGVDVEDSAGCWMIAHQSSLREAAGLRNQLASGPPSDVPDTGRCPPIRRIRSAKRTAMEDPHCAIGQSA